MLRILFCLFNLLIITACSASYEKLKTVDSGTHSSFAKNLLENYKEKAIYEAEEMHDWNSAKLYAEKALDALVGAKVKPQEMTYWKLPKRHIFKLTQSYNNLMIIYDEAKILDPYNLAIAISSLDCWAEQQEENWQTWDINQCRNDFLSAMHGIFDSLEKEFDQDLEVIKNDIEFRQEVIEVRDRGLSALEHGDLQTGLDSIYKLGQLKEEARKVDEEMRKLEEKFNN